MKTKEFMAKVRSLEFGIIQEGHQLVVRTPGCSIVARVNRTSQQTKIVTFTFASADRRELLNIISEYTGTPPEEREEEKRYYLRFIHPNILGEREPLYLHLHHSESAKDYYEIGTVKAPFGNKLQTIFTESEIAQMDITGFEKIEVTE